MAMRFFVILFITALSFSIPAASATRQRPVSRRHPYRHEYVRETFGKRALAGVGARAGLAKALQGGSYGRHLGRGMGGHVVNNSIEYPVAAARHEDLHYHRSRNRAFGPRLRHALVST